MGSRALHENVITENDSSGINKHLMGNGVSRKTPFLRAHIEAMGNENSFRTSCWHITTHILAHVASRQSRSYFSLYYVLVYSIYAFVVCRVTVVRDALFQ